MRRGNLSAGLDHEIAEAGVGDALSPSLEASDAVNAGSCSPSSLHDPLYYPSSTPPLTTGPLQQGMEACV